MRSNKPAAIHRLVRITTWTRLWFAWLAALLSGGALQRSWLGLDEIRRSVGFVILIEVEARLAPPPTMHRAATPRDWALRGWARSGRGLMRAMLGSQLRRELRRAGVARLIAIMRAPEAHIDRLAARLRRGFARQWRARPAAPRACGLVQPGASRIMAFADTS